MNTKDFMMIIDSVSSAPNMFQVRCHFLLRSENPDSNELDQRIQPFEQRIDSSLSKVPI